MNALRAEAMAIRSELARLDLVSSLATKLLQPLPAHATARVSPPDPRGNGSPDGLGRRANDKRRRPIAGDEQVADQSRG
jgi:hypothetical protein